MSKKELYTLTRTGALILALLILNSCASNWPQFRGPEQNMLATGKKLPDTWDNETNIRWTADMVGESWSSPVIFVNKVFVSAAVPVKITPELEEEEGNDPSGEEEEGMLNDIYRWEVSCFDLKSGELIWNQVAFEGNPRVKKHRAHNYAGETPVTDGKRLYAYFGMMGVFCYDLNGNLLWEKDLGAYKTQNDWGTGSSPVVHKGRLYVQVDNEESSFMVALDAATGEEVWRANRDEKTNYSTPFIWKNRERTELVAGGKKARSYDPESGELFWELEVNGRYNIPSPVADRDYLYLGNTAWRGGIPGTLFCIRAGAEGDITPQEGETTSSGVVWSHPDAPTANPSPLLYEGLLYLVSQRGSQVTCLNAFTGKQVYQEKIEKAGEVWASPWAHKDKVFFIDDKGTTSVLRAGRKFELLHQNDLDGKFWASVAVASDAYLFKATDKMYCIGE